MACLQDMCSTLEVTVQVRLPYPPEGRSPAFQRLTDEQPARTDRPLTKFPHKTLCSQGHQNNTDAYVIERMTFWPAQ